MKETLPDGTIVSTSYAVHLGQLQLGPWRPSKPKALSAFRRTEFDHTNPNLTLVHRVRTLKLPMKPELKVLIARN